MATNMKRASPHRFPLPGLLAGLLISAWPLAALAAPGDLDTSFGSGGKVMTPIGTSHERAFGVAIQTDGKIVAAGHTDKAGGLSDFAVTRYTSSGALDTSFGGGGKVTVDNREYDAGMALALQPDGKIVIGGYSYMVSSPYFTAVRLTAGGSLDTSFSTDGKVDVSFGSSKDYGMALALQTDGKIVMAGYTDVHGYNTLGLVRFNGDGTLDSGFGSGGKLTMPEHGNTTYPAQAHAVAIQTDGKIVVAGARDLAGNADVIVVRLNSNGTYDTSFNGVGWQIQDGCNCRADAVAIQSDGKIVVAGTDKVSGVQRFLVMRLKTDGTLDTGFGSGGIVSTPVGTDAGATGLAIRADGKILVSGGATVAGGGVDLALALFNSDGTLDTGFGSGGIVTTDFAGGFDYGSDVAVQADGMMVTAGTAHNAGTDDFALARYHWSTVVAPLLAIPVPTSANLYACTAAPTATVTSFSPTNAVPLAITNPTASEIRVILETAVFAGPVDVYVAANLPTGQTYLRGAGGWQPYPPATALRTFSSAALSMTSASNNLYSGPLSGLPVGSYQLYVVVLPTFTDPATFSFTTSPHYTWCYTKTFP